LSSNTVLLLVASPHGFSSTSNSLGQYLLDRLKIGGYKTSTVHVQTAMRSKKALTDMLSQVAGCDLLLLAFPLYIDCLPAALIATLELIVAQRKTTAPSKRQRLLAIVNNGFPEATQNATAIAICRQFAAEAGFDWAGGLSLGGGGTINGLKLEEAGYMARNIRKALCLAAQNLLDEKVLCNTALELMAKPIVPKSLYILIANRGWKKMAKKYGAEKKLYDRCKA